MFDKSENRDDYQHTPGPIAAMARDLADAHFIEPHRHRRAQLVYGTSGSLMVGTPHGTWVVPAHRAVWVPGGVEHSVRVAGVVTMRTLYLDPNHCRELPDHCTVISVSPLLRELIEAATRIPVDYDPDSRDGRVMALLRDELRPAAIPALQLPMPADPELAGICAEILRCPHEDRSLQDWADSRYLSRRTLARRFRAVTGYSLGQWRQQARLLAAVRMLAAGRPVALIAVELGYDSPSAFSAMFRRELGVSPSKYFVD